MRTAWTIRLARYLPPRWTGTFLLLASLWFTVSATPAVGAEADEFLDGYLSSILERDLGWSRHSFVVDARDGLVTLTLIEDDAVRRLQAERTLLDIDGVKALRVVVNRRTVERKANAALSAFPEDDIFRPLVADLREPRPFASFFHAESGGDDFVMGSVGLGYHFGLRRWSDLRPDDGWQVSYFAAAFSQFNLSATSAPLINTDFQVGIPMTYRHHSFTGRVRILHQSSHLGDELILNGDAPERINLSVEVFDFLLAFERAGWRGYGGGSYLVGREPDTLKRKGLQTGFDYVSRGPVLAGKRIEGGVDVRWHEETDWAPGVSAKLGVEFGRPYPERRGLTLMLEVYDGYSPFGQFFRQKIRYWGTGVYFDF